LPHKGGLFSYLQQMLLPRNRLVCEVHPQQTKYVEPCLFVTQNAQHSVHPTGGSLRVFRQFSELKDGSVKVALSRPTHQRVMLTVRRIVGRGVLLCT